MDFNVFGRTDYIDFGTECWLNEASLWDINRDYMMKWITSLFFILVSTTLQGAELSDECLQSMQSIYKFYYHEIQPKEGEASPEKFGEKETNQMRAIVSELKTHCPAPLIAKINQFLQEDNG